MKLTFFGAAGEVTGSCCLLETSEARLLIDIGMFQGSSQTEQKNRRVPAVRLGKLDGIVLTHAHLDHVGRLPLLVQHGYRGPVWATSGTQDIARIILEDAAHLQEEDARRESKRRLRRGQGPVQPLFGAADVAAAMPLFRTHAYEQVVPIAPGVQLRFRDAGHILGSATVELVVEDSGRKRTLVFSGDLGHAPQPLLRDPVAVEHADLVVLESTYGDRDHRPYQATVDELAGILKQAANTGGKVLIPSFAVGRTQTLLWVLRELRAAGAVPKVPVFLDSPMAIAATDAYLRHAELFDDEALAVSRAGQSPIEFDGLQRLGSAAESRELNDMRGPAVIIAGSGMCNGGRIQQHFKHQIWREETHVVLVGFMAQNTLGRALVDGAKTIKVHGESIRVKAQIHTLGGFSAHAGQSELVDWFARIHPSKRPRLVLVHGEDRPRTALRDAIAAATDVKAELPTYRQSVEA